MNRPEFTCSGCHSKKLRRSYSTSALDFPKMALGTYPFRCLDCKELSWINVWLFSKSKYAICPQCHGAQITRAAPSGARVALWKRCLLRLGAQRYRCISCNHRFVSFKGLKQGDLASKNQTDIQSAPVGATPPVGRANT